MDEMKRSMLESGFDAIQGAISGDVYRTRTMDDYKHMENVVGDVICNLMHLCKHHNLDFEAQLQYAKEHYFFET